MGNWLSATTSNSLAKELDLISLQIQEAEERKLREREHPNCKAMSEMFHELLRKSLKEPLDKEVVSVPLPDTLKPKLWRLNAWCYPSEYDPVREMKELGIAIKEEIETSGNSCVIYDRRYKIMRIYANNQDKRH